MERAPPKSFLDAMEALLRWVEGVELLLQSEAFTVSDVDVMEDNLNQYRVSDNVHLKLHVTTSHVRSLTIYHVIVTIHLMS